MQVMQVIHWVMHSFQLTLGDVIMHAQHYGIMVWASYRQDKAQGLAAGKQHAFNMTQIQNPKYTLLKKLIDRGISTSTNTDRRPCSHHRNVGSLGATDAVPYR